MTIYIIIVTSRSAVKRLSALETSEHQQARGLEKIRRIDGAKVGKHSAEWRVKGPGKTVTCTWNRGRSTRETMVAIEVELTTI